MTQFPMLVTAAIIEDKGRFLIPQRPMDKHNGGRWEFPGGKVDFGEDPRSCLAREIKEELGIEIKVLEIFEYSSHVYDGLKHVILIAFSCSYVSGTIQNKEIADYAWVAPEEFKNYDITEADLPFVDKLLNK